MNKVRRVIDDEQGAFREGRGSVDQIGEKEREKKRKVYVGFMDLDRVNREVLWQVLRMYDVGGKLMNEIKSEYMSSVVCVRVKGDKSDCFIIEICVRQSYLMSH